MSNLNVSAYSVTNMMIEAYLADTLQPVSEEACDMVRNRIADAIEATISNTLNSIWADMYFDKKTLEEAVNG